jgi:hypothetical protein
MSRPIDLVLGKLKGVRPHQKGDGWEARCPAHDDRRQSLGVAVGDDGKVLFCCQAGCSYAAIVQALGITAQDTFPDGDKRRNGRRIVATYDYQDEAGCLLYQSVRYDPRDFRQRQPDGKGGWVWSTKGRPLALYRLPELLQAALEDFVYIVEGEKDAEALHRLGLVATTNPMGAGKWRKCFNESLRDRHVILLPDNDDSGRAHMQTVCENLRGIAASVIVFELPDLPPKGDVSDWLAAGGTKEKLRQLVHEKQTPPPESNGHVAGAQEQVVSTSPGGSGWHSLGSWDSLDSSSQWPKPPGRMAFSGLAGEAVNAIAPHTEASRVALLVQFLVAFGNAIGRKAHRVIGGSRHHCNLFVVLVGQTAKGRKGTSWAWNERLFEAADPDWSSDCVHGGLSSGESLIYALRDPVIVKEAIKDKKTGQVSYNDVVRDQGVSDKRLLVVEEEFASVLRVGGREENTLSTVLRQAWDGKRMGNLTKNSPFKVTDPHVSIIGHITRPDLLQHLTGNDKANGYANRFLWVCVKRSKLLPDGGGNPDLSHIRDRLHEVLLFGKSLSTEMKRDALAADLWHRVYPKLSRERSGVLGLVTSRAEAQVSRLSMVYALLDKSDTIREAHLRAALSLWNYCYRSCKWIFGHGTGDPHADVLLKELRRTGGMTNTDIINFFGRNKSTADLKRILEPLVEQGLVIPGKPAVGRKPAEKWRLAYESTNPTNPTNPTSPKKEPKE